MNFVNRVKKFFGVKENPSLSHYQNEEVKEIPIPLQTLKPTLLRFEAKLNLTKLAMESQVGRDISQEDMQREIDYFLNNWSTAIGKEILNHVSPTSRKEGLVETFNLEFYIYKKEDERD